MINLRFSNTCFNLFFNFRMIFYVHVELKLRWMPRNRSQKQNLVADLAERPSLQHRRALLSLLGRMGRRRRRRGDFSLADKYSNQMSVPLWDLGAQIQTIPGSSLNTKKDFVWAVSACTEYKCVKEKISKMNHLFVRCPAAPKLLL